MHISPDEIEKHITDDDPKPLISSTKAAERFDITNDYVTLLCRQKKINGSLIGRMWYVEPESLQKFLKEVRAKKSEQNAALAAKFKEERKKVIANTLVPAVPVLDETPKKNLVISPAVQASSRKKIRESVRAIASLLPVPSAQFAGRTMALASLYIVAATSTYALQVKMPEPIMQGYLSFLDGVGEIQADAYRDLGKGIAFALDTSTKAMGVDDNVAAVVGSEEKLESPFFGFSIRDTWNRFLALFERGDTHYALQTSEESDANTTYHNDAIGDSIYGITSGGSSVSSSGRAPSVPAVSTAPPARPASAPTTVVNNYNTYPVVERVVTTSGSTLPAETYISILSEFSRTLRSEMSRSIGESIANSRRGSGKLTLTAGDIPDLSGSYLSLAGGDVTGDVSVSGRLGVGTTSPSDTLALQGALYLAQISTPSNTLDRLYNDGGNLYFAGNLIGGGSTGTWDSDGTNVWRSGGNVGIGTSSPLGDIHVHSGLPDVAGTIYLSNSLTGARDQIGTYSPLGEIWFGSTEAVSYQAAGIRAVGGWGVNQDFNTNDTPAHLTFWTTPNNSSVAQERLMITSGGMVLIGYGDNPQIEGTGGINDSPGSLIVNRNIGIGTTSPYARLSVVGPVAAEYYVATSTTATSTFAGGFSVGSTNFNVLQNGNVGIGTASPSSKLQLRTTTNEAQTFTLSGDYYNSGVTTNTNVILSQFQRGNTGVLQDSGKIIFGKESIWNTLNDIDGYIAFQTAQNQTLTEHLRITSAGNVGIGSTTPSARLTVADKGAVSAGQSDEIVHIQGRWAGSSSSGTTLKGLRIDLDDPAANADMYGIDISSVRASSASQLARGIRVTDTGGFSSTDPIMLDLRSTFTSVPNTSRSYRGIYHRMSLPDTATVNFNHAIYGIDSLITIPNQLNTGNDAQRPEIAGARIGINLHNSNTVNAYALYVANDGTPHSSHYGLYQEDTTVRNYFGGNVGIGTTSPYAKLSVAGEVVAQNFIATSSSASSFAGGITAFASSTVGSGTQAGGLTVNGGATTTGNLIVSGGNLALTASNSSISLMGGSSLAAVLSRNTSEVVTLSGPNNGSINLSATGGVGVNESTPDYKFEINGTAENGYFGVSNSTDGDIFTINSSGNVGVGTTTPTTRLHVAGSSFNLLNLERSDANGSNILFSNSAGELASIGALMDESLTFRTGDSTIGSTRMVITSTGNIGIGTTSPYSKLTVWGADTLAGSKAFEVVNSASSTALSIDNAGFISAGYNNSNFFTIDAASGTTTIANLSIGNLNFETNAGVVALSNIPVDSNAAQGVIQSQSINIGDTPVATFYGESDGAGGVQNLRVGIGSTTPWGKFSIHSTAGAPQFVIGSSTTQFIVDQNGKVGIGTTTPSARLSVTTSGATIMNLENTVAGGGIWSLYLGDSASAIGGNNLGIGPIGGSANSKLVIQDEGNIGIGTTSPQEKLHISGNIRLASTSDTSIQFYENSTGRWSTSYSVAGDYLYMRDLQNGRDLFRLYDNGNAIFLAEAGNVGIGTTSPYAKLSVVGEVAARNFTATSTTATTTIAGGFTVGSGAINYDYSSGVTSINNLAVGSWSFDTDAGIVTWVDLPISSNATASTVESYTAQIGGSNVLTVYGEANGSGAAQNLRVGIGTSTPWRTLSVNGTVAMSGLTGATGAGSLCLDSNNEVVYNSASNDCLESIGASKHDIKTLGLDGVATLKELNPVSFIYNWDTSSTTRFGFIADDVARIDSHLVTYNATGKISGLDNYSLVAVIVKAFKELIAKVDSFAQRFTTQELCVGSVCVTEEEFLAIVEAANIDPEPEEPVEEEPAPEEPIEEPTEEEIGNDEGPTEEAPTEEEPPTSDESEQAEEEQAPDEEVPAEEPTATVSEPVVTTSDPNTGGGAAE